MKLANEERAGLWLPRPPALEAVLGRLEALSLAPAFAGQREVALNRALKPYAEGEVGTVLDPLEQEADQARLILYCDFYPEDGQLTLLEQLRDTVSEHVGSDERLWLDPLKHSYLDLLEVSAPPGADRTLLVRSLGDGTAFRLPATEQTAPLTAGEGLLTRVVRDPAAYESGQAFWTGSALVLSPADAQALLEQTVEWRQEMEMMSGSFTLGEWQEFAKRYGHMLLWGYAKLRMQALVDAVRHIDYRHENGEPYLYAVALYDHHEFRFVADGLAEMTELAEEPPPEDAAAGGRRMRRWIQREARGGREVTVARITLTSSQLIVECDRPERLDALKHRVAAAFGFSLHFRGETLTPPARKITVEELAGPQPLTLVVTADEDRELLKKFLEEAYLEWSDQPHRALGGQTPRHAAASAALRDKVAALIDDMEASDPGLWRTGRRAYDYNVLRAHVGLDEVSQ